MALRINTNVAALNAHKNMIKNDNSLSASLEKLSSGLRINKAADDASGMAIADSLKSQALGLGQAIRNANDGISMVQTADGALEESINIVNTIKTKAIQAAQDGQTTDSRKAIQADINKLMEELDMIAKTTSFNNQKLLSGQFTNKKFQVGAYAQETVNISIGSSESTKIGHIAASELTFAGEGVTELNLYSNVQNTNYSLAPMEIRYDNTRESSLGAVADAINQLSDKLGVSAEASVVVKTDGQIAAGDTGDFTINGVTISSLTVQNNDANGALVASINQKTDQHGVFASVGTDGYLTLTSTDDRAIKVEMTTAGEAVFGGTSSAEMSTFGKITLTQTGAGDIIVSDRNAQAGIAVSTLDGNIKVSGISGTTQLSVAQTGSILASGTVLASGSAIQGTFTLQGAGATVTSGGVNFAGAGSMILCGSTIGSGITLAAKAEIATTTGSNSTSTLTAGTFLESGSYLESGSVFAGDVTAYLSGAAAGSVVLSGGNTYVTCGATVIVGGLTLTAGATMSSGSTLGSGTILNAGSTVYDDLVLTDNMTLTSGMSLGTDSILLSGSVMKTGSVFGSIVVSGNGKVEGTMTLEVGTVIADESYLTTGSSLGGDAILTDDETVAAGKDMLVTAGSTLASGSIITAGTVLTNDILGTDGAWYAIGTTLEADVEVACGDILNDQILNGGSVLLADTVLAANSTAVAETVESSVGNTKAYRLSDVDVTSQEGAQIGIAVADAALKSLDKVRSDLGSVQNQLTSTIANISTTRVNISAAESSIRDVDFAEESANFSKMQILTQASTFAMAQANASAQNVLSLLQG
jgi:flagellin